MIFAGVHIGGVLLAALAMYFVGFVFYGLLFSKIWQASRGLVDEQLQEQSPMWMAGGFGVELISAVGIAWLMSQMSISDLSEAALFGLTAGVLVGVPMRSYEFIYNIYHSLPGAIVDWAHVICTFVVCAIVYSYFV